MGNIISNQIPIEENYHENPKWGFYFQEKALLEKILIFLLFADDIKNMQKISPLKRVSKEWNTSVCKIYLSFGLTKQIFNSTQLSDYKMKCIQDFLICAEQIFKDTNSQGIFSSLLSDPPKEKLCLSIHLNLEGAFPNKMTNDLLRWDTIWKKASLNLPGKQHLYIKYVSFYYDGSSWHIMYCASMARDPRIGDYDVPFFIENNIDIVSIFSYIKKTDYYIETFRSGKNSLRLDRQRRLRIKWEHMINCT